MAAEVPSGFEKTQEAHHVEVGADSNTLSEPHRQFLLDRHATVDLDPIPEATDADPYNWPKHKKVINLTLIAFHAMMATFTAASIQSAFANIAMDLDVSIQRASYLTSLVIAVLGGAPLFWRPLSQRYGRRPIFLISLIGSLVGNIGCSRSPSFGTMGLCRAITAFMISPAAAIGSGVVTEMFFKKERAHYMGIWTIMVTLGVPVAPFIFGFVALRVSYRWIYWTLAIVNAVQFILYFFIGSETRYVRGQEEPQHTTHMQRLLSFRRIDPTPLTWWDFVQPLSFFLKPRVFFPAFAYAMVFLLASVMITILIPQLYVELFGLNTQEVGLQNLSVIIGTIIGEQIGGIASDKWMLWRQRKTGVPPPPEHRLWLAYLGYPLAVCGIAVFLIQLGDAGKSWNITPDVGAGIASAGNQIVTTVLVTYAVDNYRPEAASVGVFITFIRQTWGFIGPFWFPQMITNTGFRASTGISAALIIVASVIPTIILQVTGHRLRK